MRPLAQGVFTEQQVKDALTAGSRAVDFRYDILDTDGSLVGPLRNVESCHVEHAAFADIPRICKLQLAADRPGLIFGRHRVQPYMRLRMSGGTFTEWPLGVFLLSTPVRVTRGSGYGRAVEGYDQTSLLVDDLVPARVSYAAGANVIVSATTELTNAGISSALIAAEPSAATLPVAVEWAPGTPRLRIVNDLLTRANYARLWFDGYGQAVLRPYRPPSTQAPDYTYADDAASVTSPQLADTLDLYATPNRWIGMVSEPERPPLLSVYTNTNAASPTSTVSRGRTIARLLETRDIVDQATLDAYVQRIAQEASQVYRSVEFDTALMPMHEHFDLLTLNLTGLGVTGAFTETRWQMELKAGALMKHTARLLVAI